MSSESLKVTLSNVKGVSSLEFIVPKPGVWIISGLNGSGKTSLFASLYRLRNPNAFQRYFRAGSESSRVDRYTRAAIEYALGKEVVTYKYGGQRWRASPRRNAELLTKSQFPNVHYIEANAERVEPYPNEIKTRRVKSCDDDLRSLMSDVMSDKKWRGLSYVNTSRGQGSQRAHLVPYSESGKNYFYSEKSFSLGELCVLKLAIRMLSANDGDLVLIDEVEMALHPQAQIRLFAKIKNIAESKCLTVLFSTHSSTLIKNCEREKLIHLSQTPSKIDVQYGPYPARVLGEIAFDEELTTDFIFFVEDKDAKLVLEHLIVNFMELRGVMHATQPTYKVVPVGGIREVLAILSETPRLFPSYVRRYAFLDNDAKAVVEADSNGGRVSLAQQYRAIATQFGYLPWTPELGAIEFIEKRIVSDTELCRRFNEMFPGSVVNIGHLVNSSAYKKLNKASLNERAKDRLSYLVKEVSEISSRDEVHVRRCIYGMLVEIYRKEHRSDLQSLLGPIFRLPTSRA